MKTSPDRRALFTGLLAAIAGMVASGLAPRPRRPSMAVRQVPGSVKRHV